ncbi:hypothetical protein [Spirosoma sp.]|uniref:hypothetical protein n=1 Tax=Spirosoma sp. TaxID=1899569 RepID=UPI0026246359|nr:hypothetical protein [Spirosoma sp.]MCX6214615.1 hypothetical protein [Spirosoma sp.]
MISEDPVERWEQLEDYLRGRMEDGQSRQLEERMKTDTKLTDELVSVRRAQALLTEALAEQQMRATLRQIRVETSVNTRSASWMPVKWNQVVLWAAAACVLLMSYLSIVPVKLPDAGYDVMALRRIDTTQLSGQQRIAFENFFEGQARMVEGDYVQAAHHFENVLTVEDLRPYFKEAAEWHLAVSYLQSHQFNRASQLYRRLRYCNQCAYEVGWLNRRKMEWKLFIAGLWL